MDPSQPSKSLPVAMPYAWVILVVVYLASVAAPLNSSKVPPIMPLLMQDLHIDLIQAGGLMSIIALVGLLLALPAGVILQRFGSLSTGLAALGFLTCGAVLGALSDSYSFLAVSRLVEGIGIGLIGVVAPATIAMWFPPALQGTAMGIWATWVPVGSLIAYGIAPGLSAGSGWRAVWWAGAAFTLVTMLLYAFLVRRPPLPAGDELQGQQPLDFKRALANRDIWLLGFQFACFALAMVPIGTFYPTFLSEMRGFSLGQAAFISNILTFMAMLSAPISGWISDRIGSRRLLFTLPYVIIAVLLLFPFNVTGWQIYALLIVQGLIVGSIPTATFTAAPELMKKPQWAGLGLAVILLGQNVGVLVGPLIFGELVNRVGWAGGGYWMIPVCLLGFISGWMVRVR
jgi:predicted MFS family arabinose efflux permease